MLRHLPYTLCAIACGPRDQGPPPVSIPQDPPVQTASGQWSAPRQVALGDRIAATFSAHGWIKDVQFATTSGLISDCIGTSNKRIGTHASTEVAGSWRAHEIGTWTLEATGIGEDGHPVRIPPFSVEVVEGSGESDLGVVVEPSLAWEGQLVRARLEGLPSGDGHVAPRVAGLWGDALHRVWPQGKNPSPDQWDSPDVVWLQAARSGEHVLRPVVALDKSDFSAPCHTSTYAMGAPSDTQLSILPLPPAPRGFDGLVGDASLEVRLATSRSDPQPESAYLTINLQGDGWFTEEHVPEPTSNDAALTLHRRSVRHFYAIGDGPGAKPTLFSDVRFTWELEPREGSLVSVKPIEVVYFDPGNGIFKTLSVTPEPVAIPRQ